MKKITITLTVLLFATIQAFASTITIVTSGFSYSPASASASVGDTVSIAGSSSHPTVQVDQATWNANGATPMVGGWGTKTTTYTFVIAAATDIYYVCANHVASNGMKGMISVTGSGINNPGISYAISLFPNPAANGEFTLKAEGYAASGGKAVLYDTEGKILESHNLTGETTRIQSKVPAGAYFYEVIIGNQLVHRGKFFVNSSK